MWNDSVAAKYDLPWPRNGTEWIDGEEHEAPNVPALSRFFCECSCGVTTWKSCLVFFTILHWVQEARVDCICIRWGSHCTAHCQYNDTTHWVKKRSKIQIQILISDKRIKNLLRLSLLRTIGFIGYPKTKFFLRSSKSKFMFRVFRVKTRFLTFPSLKGYSCAEWNSLKDLF